MNMEATALPLLLQKLDEEADRLWDEGILNQEKLDEIRQTDLHAENRE